MNSPPPTHISRGSSQAGFTLIEIVVAVVVLAIGIGGSMAALSAISVQSADAMVTAQATAIASAYLNEVLQKPFGISDGHTTRPTLDVVDDYNGLNDIGVRDQTGTLVAGLDQYTVTVSVVPGILGSVPAAEVREVDVRVVHSSGVTVLLSGYRTKYP
ncbi:MAG TPA: prepilin-type N-terminal cleavage/methylation domain-containing protein [Steroidobacteraceae bacterium]